GGYMQKIIIAVLLLVMASVPVAAHAMVVIISEDGIPTTFPRPGEPHAGDSIAVKYTQGSKVYCEAASNGALGAKFLFRESGDIKDMVISYLICINASPTDPATLKLYFNHFFPVTNIDSRYYVMSVQGSFFNINSGGPGHGSPLNASSYVTFFNSGLQPSNPVPIGASSGSFTAAFGPQSPRQLVNLLNRSEEHTSELQSHRDLHSFPTLRSSDLSGLQPSNPVPIGASSGSFTAAFGPQSPRQLVNLLN